MRSKLYNFIFFLTFFWVVPYAAYTQCTCTAGVGDQTNLELYWVGSNSNNYNDICNWRLNSVVNTEVPCQAPRSSDNVYFMAAALTAGDIITLDQGSNCLSMTWELTAPAITLNGGNRLDIYGSLQLAPNLAWDTREAVNFKNSSASPLGLRTFKTSGVQLRVYRIAIDVAIGNSISLQDKLDIDDATAGLPSANSDQGDGGILQLLTGGFISNGYDLYMDYFWSFNGDNSRVLDLQNSQVYIRGRNSVSSSNDPILFDFNSTGTNYTSVLTTGSHIHAFHSEGTAQTFSLGNTITYDTLSVSTRLNIISGANLSFSYIYINNRTRLDLRANTTVDTIFMENSILGTTNKTLTLNGVVDTNQCNGLSSIETMTIVPQNTTALLQNLTLQSVQTPNLGDCTADACIDAANNSTNIVYTNTLTARRMRFQESTDVSWHTVGNWQTWNGSTWDPAGCLPTLLDDVEFDGSSFLAAGKTLDISAPAYCLNMHWLPAVAATPNINVNIATGSNYSAPLIIGGNLELNAAVDRIEALIKSGDDDTGIQFLGLNTTNTITTAGVYARTWLQFRTSAQYTIIGDINCGAGTANIGISALPNTFIRMENASIQAPYLFLAACYLNNVDVHIYGRGTNGSVCYEERNFGGTAPYDQIQFLGTTSYTFYHQSTARIRADLLPTVIVPNGSRMDAWYRKTVGGQTIQGDLIVEGEIHLRQGSTNIINLTITGNTQVSNGGSIFLSDASASSCLFQGNINLQGTCVDYVSLSSQSTAPANFNYTGTINADYAAIRAINNQGAAFNANNCIDNGNNATGNPINFVNSAGQTYYWRASALDATDFNGNWSDPNHWTTNPLLTQGNETCPPSIADSVVFDALSLSGGVGGNATCTIDVEAFCEVLNMVENATIQGTEGLNVGASVYLYPNSTNRFNFRGILAMKGNKGYGYFQSNGTQLEVNRITFTGTESPIFDLLDDLDLSNGGDQNRGRLIISQGTFRSNGHTITINQDLYVSSSALGTNLDIQNSIINIYARRIPNGINVVEPAGNSITINATGSTLNFAHPNATHSSSNKELYFSNGYTWNNVYVRYDGYGVNIRGSSSFGHLELDGDGPRHYFIQDNSMDSLTLNGGNTYMFQEMTTQTLNAPHGKLISKNVGPSSFINLETNISNSAAYIYKEYGESFCLNYIKVRDVQATKAAAQPAACTLPDCWDLLEFQTDQNSDSISILNSDWGIWRFKLAPLVNPVSSGTDTVIICKTGASLSYPIQILGTSPYIIDYSWEDASNPATNGGETGLLVNDDDDNPNTPFIYNVPLNPIVNKFNYTVDIATSRCGSRILSTPVQTHVIVPTPEPLVQANRTGSCVFENEGDWYAILDDQDERPIVSLLDSTGVSDTDSLGLVNVEVSIEPSVGTLPYNGGTPYLQRHWQITPTNNRAAKVRLYFTQTELNALSVGTYYGGNLTLNPATELIVLKYGDGTFPASLTPTVVAHTVVAQNGIEWAGNPTAAAPFSSTTDVIAIEFEVTGFSHFVIVPTQSALFSVEDLLSFEAKLEGKTKVQTKWTIETTKNIKTFIVQQTTNYIGIVDKGSLPIVKGQLSYGYVDTKPMVGDNYYRLKIIDNDGSISYSDWKAVNVQGAAQAVVYPNPTTDVLNVQLYQEEASALSFSVVSVLGEILFQQKKTIGLGLSTVQLTVEALPVGTYVLILEDTRTGITTQYRFTKK